jgi:LasA protease
MIVKKPIFLLLLTASLALAALACNLPETTLLTPRPTVAFNTPLPGDTAATPFSPFDRDPSDPILTPTPDAPHPLPTLRSNSDIYNVKAGDTLGIIADIFGIAPEALAAANSLTNPDLLSVGQQLLIPPPVPGAPAPDFKILPDSELINGPLNVSFDIDGYVQSWGGYLAGYSEAVAGQTLSGAQIVNLVAVQYSVNPRLLLTALEFQSGWLRQPHPPEDTLVYPIGYGNPNWDGLYKQLAWAANQLNRGYYWWRVNALGAYRTLEGTLIPASPFVNAGTAGVQYFLALLYPEADWRQAVGPAGLYAQYNALFGFPFDWEIEILPPGVTQPTLQLPFEPRVAWNFTGGPHGGWDGGSAWAALDFSPPGEPRGCVESDDWVVAMADGPIVRANDGAVIQDLDGDGFEQTGWVLFYMHVESRGRVQAGEYLRAGERIGHPSCEGGISSGTHTHIARRFNGEWIPADGSLPFVMDGWVSVGTGVVYNGYMRLGDQTIEACECRIPGNTIQR